MAATGLLALLDDITAVLDDVAAMSKVAAQKTAGIAGDDLAVGAETMVGLAPERELPIVGKVALGSIANKCVLVPLALALPTAAITPLLMCGGTFLCYEGVHKVMHKAGPQEEAHHDALLEAVRTGPEAVAEIERGKVKQAIFTDIVLSAEIVAVSLGAVADQPFQVRAGTLTVVALGMTVAIYGLVAAIVKLDDIGLHLQRTGAEGSFKRRLGEAIVAGAPHLMRVISVVGTVAMFLVGGEIILHGFHGVEEWVHHGVEALTHNPALEWVLMTLAGLTTGVVVGIVASAAVAGLTAAWRAVRGEGGAPAGH